MSFDAGSIEATATLERQPFIEGLRLLRNEARKFTQEKITPTADVDTRAADAKVLQFRRRLRGIDDTKPTATVALDASEAGLRLSRFEDRLDGLRKKVATARVAADTDAAKLRLDQLDIQLRKLGQTTARPNVDLRGVARAELALEALQLRIDAINRGGSAGGGGRGGGGAAGGAFRGLGSHAPGFLPLALGAAAPLAIPLGGLALGGAASLLTPTLAGGAGLGLFGAAAKSSVTTLQKDVTKLTALQVKYNAATTDKQRAAILKQEAALWAGLDPQQRAAVRNVKGLDDAWKSFQKRLEPTSFKVLAEGSGLLTTGLKVFGPAAEGAGKALGGLLREGNDALQSPFYRKFSSFLGEESALAVTSLGTAVGHVLDGVAHLAMDFAPLGNDLETWLVNVSKRFDLWTQGNGPAKFVAWVEKEAPPAAKAIAGLAHAAEGIGKGLSPIAAVELKLLTPVLEEIGKLGDEHPEVITAVGAGLLTVGAGLKLIQGAVAIKGLVTNIGLLMTWFTRLRNTAGEAAAAEELALNPKGGAGGAAGGLAGKGGIGAGGIALGVVGTAVVAGSVANQLKHSKPGTLNHIVAGAGGLLPFGSQPGELGPSHKLERIETGPGGVQTIYKPGSTTVDQAATNRNRATQVNNDLADMNRLLAANIPLSSKVTSKAEAFATALANLGVVTARNCSPALEGNTDAVQQNRAALTDAALKVFAYRDSLIKAGVPLDDVKRRTSLYAQQLETTATHVYGNKTAVDHLLGSLHAMPKQVATSVKLNGGAAAVKQARTLGQQIADGLISGMSMREAAVASEAQRLAGGVTAAIRAEVRPGSPSKVTTYYGKMLAEGLIVGMRSRLAALQSTVASVTATLASLRGTSDQFASGIAGTISGEAALTNTPNQSVPGIIGFLSGQAAKDAQFNRQLAAIGKLGLRTDLVSQLAQAGPGAAGNIVNNLAHASRGDLARINVLDKQVLASSAAAGRLVAGDVYGAQLTALQRELSGLRGDVKQVTASLTNALRVGHHQTRVTPHR